MSTNDKYALGKLFIYIGSESSELRSCHILQITECGVGKGRYVQLTSISNGYMWGSCTKTSGDQLTENEWTEICGGKKYEKDILSIDSLIEMEPSLIIAATDTLIQEVKNALAVV
jgi:hypothetical protein